MRDPMMSDLASMGGGRRSRLREDFDFNDLNRDGQLTLAEFLSFMRNTDADMTAEECQTAFDEIDTNSDGLIDFARFLTWWNERLVE